MPVKAARQSAASPRRSATVCRDAILIVEIRLDAALARAAARVNRRFGNVIARRTWKKVGVMRTVLVASAVSLAVAGAHASVNTPPKARLAAAARIVRNVQATIPAG